jgi:hypothetical protein
MVLDHAALLDAGRVTDLDDRDVDASSPFGTRRGNPRISVLWM